MMDKFHIPVLLKEAIEYLNVEYGGRYIDATVGGGGHTAEILKRGGRVLGIDRDPDALEYVRSKFNVEVESGQLILKRGNFAKIDALADEGGFGFGSVSGVLYDLGMSSYQLEHSGRGFSFKKDEPLDMRMNPNLKVTAQDLVNGLSKNELIKLFTTYGEERFARRYAGAIVRARKAKRIETTGELANLIEKQAPSRGRIHPATRVFQALRIAVNDELNSLQSSLPRALEILGQDGRLVVITFHSLEDSIVDQFMSNSEGDGVAKCLTPAAIAPSEGEVEENPRASSAKLRVLKKL